MKKFFTIFTMCILLCGCQKVESPDLTTESPPTNRTLAERLIVNPTVYLMLQEQEEFYDICEQAYKVREVLNIRGKDPICLLSLNSASKQLGNTYVTLNKKFNIDNVQTYVIAYLQSSISYSKGLAPDDITTISEIIVNTDLHEAWNTTFLNIHSLITEYDDPDYEAEQLFASAQDHKCLFDYWYNNLQGAWFDYWDFRFIASIFSSCGHSGSTMHETLHSMWSSFTDYYLMFPPPLGSKDNSSGGSDGGGGGSDGGGGDLGTYYRTLILTHCLILPNHKKPPLKSC